MWAQLLLPTIISAVMLFFASFLSWMVLQLHRQDWIKLDKENEFIEAARNLSLAPGSYMFPGCNDLKEMQEDEYKKKFEQGPVGILTVFGKVSMGRNLGLTFLYFLIVNYCLSYLARLALEPGADFISVFRFVSTAGLLVYLSAIVQHAIWFHSRIVGHVIESIAYAAIVGAIFGAMWPGA